MKHKVIFDTDPGVDDAMALYFALAHPDIDVVGITATFGNVSVEQAATNALYLTRLTGREISVAQGVPAPMVKTREEAPDFIHGADGLGNLPSRVAVRGELETLAAAEYIVSMARKHPGELTLVAVGPLGNLGLALKLEPKLPQLIKQVVLMGGAVEEPGNVSPVAEANIWNDPHAADLVFTAGWKVTMVGLDVTHRVALQSSFFKSLAEHHKHIATDTLLHAVMFYAGFYSSIRPELGHGCFAHDVLAFVWLVAPELFKTKSGRLRVATEGIANGQTMLDKHGGLNYPQAGWPKHMGLTDVCVEVDAKACTELVDKTLRRDWLKPELIV